MTYLGIVCIVKESRLSDTEAKFTTFMLVECRIHKPVKPRIRCSLYPTNYTESE